MLSPTQHWNDEWWNEIGIYDVAEVGAIYAENIRAIVQPKDLRFPYKFTNSFVCTALYFRTVENLWFCLCNDFSVNLWIRFTQYLHWTVSCAKIGYVIWLHPVFVRFFLRRKFFLTLDMFFLSTNSAGTAKHMTNLFLLIILILLKNYMS